MILFKEAPDRVLQEEVAVVEAKKHSMQPPLRTGRVLPGGSLEGRPSKSMLSIFACIGWVRNPHEYWLIPLRTNQHGAIELRTFHPGFATTLSDRPCASAVARMAAADEINIVSLALTSHALPDPLTRHLLTLLDGTRDRRQLLEAMETADDRRIEEALQMLLRGGMLRS